MRLEIRRHTIVFGIYFTVVMLFHWVWTWELVGYWIGGGIGYLLVFLDRLLYAYILYPHEQLSQQLRFQIESGNVKEALELVHRRREEQQKLVFRSFLFAAVWVPLALFAVTSSAGLYGSALVMGVGLHLIYDFWRDQQIDVQMLNKKLFWQVKRVVTQKEQKWFLYLFSGAFVWLTLILI